MQPWRGVVVRGDHALDPHTRAGAALLAIGDDAVVCGSTAVALHGYDAADGVVVHVNIPHSRLARSRPGLVVHRHRFQPDDVVDLGGLPVLPHDLALAEFLCSRQKWAAFASLDQALRGLDARANAALKSSIRRRLELRSDRRGVKQAQFLVDLATGKADSPPESFFRLIVVEAGFPIPEPQLEILTIDGDLLFILDMAWKRLRIGLEFDGYAAHETRGVYDEERDRRLAGRGWIIIRACVTDLKDPTPVLSELRRAFAERSR